MPPRPPNVDVYERSRQQTVAAQVSLDLNNEMRATRRPSHTYNISALLLLAGQEPIGTKLAKLGRGNAKVHASITILYTKLEKDCTRTQHT